LTARGAEPGGEPSRVAGPCSSYFARSSAATLDDFHANLIDEHQTLGMGSFGVVKLFRDRLTEERRVVKYDLLSGELSLAEWEREESVFWALAASADPSTRYIIRLCASWTGKFNARHIGAFVMEACDRSVLEDLMLRKPYIPPLGAALTWAAQLMHGLALLHSLNLLHRDMKPHNVLLQGPGDAAVLKIADMVSSCRGAALMTSADAALQYRAPEMLFGADVMEADPG